jgi:hypothetical protein
MGLLAVTGAQAETCHQTEGKPLAEWDFQGGEGEAVKFNITCEDDYDQVVDSRNKEMRYGATPYQAEPSDERSQRD